MNIMTKTELEVAPLTRHIGAEIRGIDLREKPDDATVKAIYQAWLDHLVIIFPTQKLSQEDLIRATSYFGELGELSRPAKYHPPGFSRMLPGIMLISNIRENGEPIGALPDGEMMFHHDMIHREVPSKGTLLYSVEIPTHGGETLFASGYAAYETIDLKLLEPCAARLSGRPAEADAAHDRCWNGRAVLIAMMTLLHRLAIVLCALAFCCTSALAQSDFYRGKTVNLVVSASAGGGYDIMGR